MSGNACNIQVLRGLSSNRSLLSCSADGRTVDLWSEVDNSGRQVWQIVLASGHTDVFNIVVSGGVSSNRKFLSCSSDGGIVDLWDHDDGSGRQQWLFVPVRKTGICSYFNIKVNAGVTGNRTLLSCTSDGKKVDLWNQDDGSGRQRWQRQPLEA